MIDRLVDVLKTTCRPPSAEPAARPLRIAVIAHLRHPIAAPFMGGMEAHCHGLVTALVARGHDVTLFASGDSDPSLPLQPVAPRHYEHDLPWALWRGTDELTAFQEAAFSRAWAVVASGGFDVVHNNAMHPSLHRWAVRDGVPMVTSLHVPPFAGLADAIAANRAPWLRQTVTSEAHRRSWWLDAPDSASVVHNGIDVGRWPFHAVGNGRAIWSGRITPTKGTAIALAAARDAGIPLDVIGPIDCQTYFDEEVAPLLNDQRHYRGLLSNHALARALGSASVLIATPMWDEPFGLAAVEAMAGGVPVAALDRGALREVIGNCGSLARDIDELPTAVHAALGVPRDRCRMRVENLFAVNRMIGGYEQAYAAAIAGLVDCRSASTRALLA